MFKTLLLFIDSLPIKTEMSFHKMSSKKTFIIEIKPGMSFTSDEVKEYSTYIKKLLEYDYTIVQSNCNQNKFYFKVQELIKKQKYFEEINPNLIGYCGISRDREVCNSKDCPSKISKEVCDYVDSNIPCTKPKFEHEEED
jgi:hypothetical protein